MRKEEKEQLVAELQRMLAENADIILADYRGLTVKELIQLRRTMSGAGGQLKVIKKTLFRRALAEEARAGLTDYLEGPVAAAFISGDALGVLKEMSAFARTHPQLELKGGWIESQLFGGEQLAELATLPPREEMLGRLAGVLLAPLAELVGVLQAVPRDLALSLKAVIKQREEAGAQAAA